MTFLQQRNLTAPALRPNTGMGHRPATQMNPQRFRNLMDRLSPEDRTDVAMKLHSRAQNATEVMNQTSEAALKVGVLNITTFTMGLLDGMDNANRESLIEKWEDGGAAEANVDIQQYPTPFGAPGSTAKDPTMFFNFLPKTLAATLVLTGIGVFENAATPFVRAAALGGSGYFTGRLGYQLGRTLRMRRLRAAQEAEANQSAAA